MDKLESIFSINQFLELELWLKSVPILFRSKRFPFSKSGKGTEGDFKEELQLALEMLRRVAELCEQLKSSPKPDGNWGVWQEEDNERPAQDNGSIEALASSMKQCRTIVGDMLGQVAVDLRLFNSVGNLLRHEFETFRHSTYFTDLNYGYFESKVQPVISTNVLARTRSIPLKVEVTEIFVSFVRLMAYLRFMNGKLKGVYR